MNFAHPHFAEPRWLWLAVLGPVVLVALQRYSAWARRKQLAQLAAPEFVADLTRSHSPVRRAIKNAMLVLAVAGIGLALARPQWGEQAETGYLLGQDVVFVLDCSRSMLATDVAPSRLQRAKLAILDFVQRHGHGRIVLVKSHGLQPALELVGIAPELLTQFGMGHHELQTLHCGGRRCRHGRV